MKVEDIMTREVVTVAEKDTLQEVSKVFFERSISGAPVLDSTGEVVGMVSESDIVKSVKPYEERLKMIYPSLSFMSVTFEKNTEEKAIDDVVREVQHKTVREIMSRQVHTLSPDDPISKAVTMINEENVNRLPVIIEGKLVGIVTRADILRCLALIDLGFLEGA
ncbi:MAG: CBS domain-containing protein [Methanomassiliicoccales archaeon]|nr:CBS domain-containing protein [Methanomassiliicoccales archaeon]NYT15336.1 CBS domain-containing protein [Methanomassiliicoccales archaeon]